MFWSLACGPFNPAFPVYSTTKSIAFWYSYHGAYSNRPNDVAVVFGQITGDAWLLCGETYTDESNINERTVTDVYYPKPSPVSRATRDCSVCTGVS